MESTFVLAQLHPLPDPEENLGKAKKAMLEAREKYHADLILFPEMFMSQCDAGADVREANRWAQAPDGSFVQGMRELAKAFGLWTLFGMRELPGNLKNEENRVYNRTVLLNERGETVSAYRKTHLYDAFGYRESDFYLRGDQLMQPVETPFGKIGIFVCYELRFPEIARKLALEGAQMLLVPAAWASGERKKEQFQLLAQTRALENTVYLLACDQCGGSTAGGSLAVDPLGRILAQAEEEEQLLSVRIDTDAISEVRKCLPCLEQRRPELY